MTFVDVLWSLFPFAEGNVCANGACDRVIRVVRCRGTSDAEHCEMMQDGVAQLLSFLLPSFVKLVFC